MTTDSLFDADHLLYVGELACAALLLVLDVGFIIYAGWLAFLGATFTFLLGMMFAILWSSRRDIHLVMRQKGEE